MDKIIFVELLVGDSILSLEKLLEIVDKFRKCMVGGRLFVIFMIFKEKVFFIKVF